MIKKLFIAFFLLVITGVFVCNAKASLIQPIHFSYNQNIHRFVAKKNAHKALISSQKQMKYQRSFFKHFFSPWQASASHKKELIAGYRSAQAATTNHYRRYLGRGENYHLNTKAWFDEIIANMDMSGFPNKDSDAILVHNAMLRYVPTLDPHFGNPHVAGQGYPFDDFQKSMLMVGSPIHVYHISKHGDWAFVASAAVFGWIQTKDLAYVDADFIDHWGTKNYVATVVKKFSVKDTEGIYRFDAYLGAVFPIAQIENQAYTILIPAADIKRKAVILKAKVASNIMQKMPVASTPANFARVIEQLLGESYGWGGSFFLTDCSSALKNIYTAFGIWLPRNSCAQSNIGKKVDLSHLSAAQRQNYIVRYAIPFVTLIHVPGHIMMYLGNENGKVMTFQNVWAFQTWTSREGKYFQGRAVVGKALLMPLELEYQHGLTPQIAVNELDISYL